MKGKKSLVFFVVSHPALRTEMGVQGFKAFTVLNSWFAIVFLLSGIKADVSCAS